MRWAAITAAILATAAIVARIASLSYASRSSRGTAPEKSIAVLPFENRSEEKANAYFADGIQDEILTRLSQDRRFKSDLAHIHAALQKRAGKPA